MKCIPALLRGSVTSIDNEIHSDSVWSRSVLQRRRQSSSAVLYDIPSFNALATNKLGDLWNPVPDVILCTLSILVSKAPDSYAYTYARERIDKTK